MKPDTHRRPLHLGVVVGSTRPNRRAHHVADWVCAGAARRGALDVTVLDLADFDLPLLDEPEAPAMGPAQREHTRRWARAVAKCDGYVFVVPEYNHSLPGALKNALDYVFAEWHDKVAGAVGYGVQGGVRSVEHLRQVLIELSVANVRSAVWLDLFGDFTGDRPTPHERHQARLLTMLDELVGWGAALRGVREGTS